MRARKIRGGAEGDRTPDLMTASHALSQLRQAMARFNTLELTLVAKLCPSGFSIAA
jgi:hypothetical protein